MLVLLCFVCTTLPGRADASAVRIGRARQRNVSPLITAYRPTVREVRSKASGLLHPGLGMTKAQLNTMQKHVRNGDEPWASAFAQFATQSRSSLVPRTQYQPEWTEILHGPLGKAGNYITFRMAMDGDVAFHQSIMWYITGNEVYRRNALNTIRNYYSITKVEPHWDSQIRWGIAAYKLCFVADLLRYSEGNTDASRWTDNDQAKFTHLMEMGKGLIIGPGYWMNQHGFSTMGLMGTAIVLDDKALYEEAVERATVNARGEQGGRNGSIKWQMRLVTENSVTHAPVAPPHVQVAEMARDQGHAWLNPAALSLLSQIIVNQGTRIDPVKGTVSRAPDAVDPFSFLDNRLLAGTDYLTRYHLGEPVVWYPLDGKPDNQIKGEPYRKPVSSGILYNYYRYTKKWDVNNSRFRAVARAYEANPPEGDGGTDFPGNGTLFYTPDKAAKP